MEDGTTFVGMDLGTFKTAVASSTGNRAVVQTIVGWPKDLVARAMLGVDVLIGEDVNDHRLALDVVRPFYKGGLKYLDHTETGVSEGDIARHLEAARLIVRHAVGQIKQEAEGPVFGIIGAPSRATDANLELLLDAAEEAFDAAMIVPEPFTIAYGMGRLTSTLIIDIGAGTTDICTLYGTFPKEEDQITIPMGGDFVDAKFLELMGEHHPTAQLSQNMARKIKETHGFVHDVDEPIEVTLPKEGVPTNFDIAEPLRQACRTLVDPIVEGVFSLVSRFDPEFQQPLLKQIVLGGGGSRLDGLSKAIEERLEPLGGAKVTRVYDSVFAGASGALKLAMTMSSEEWESMQQLSRKAA